MALFAICAARPGMADVLTDVQVTDLQVVSTVRVGRTVWEYTLRPVVTNGVGSRFQGVIATLESTPPQIVAVPDGVASFGDVAGGATVASTDTIRLRASLLSKTTLADLGWRIEGSIPPNLVPGIYMQIDGGRIPGDAAGDGHSRWIELSSVTSDRTVMSVKKHADSSSTPLLAELLSGAHVDEIRIEIVRSCGGLGYVGQSWTLTDVVFTGVQTVADGGLPTEAITLDSARVDWMVQTVTSGCELEPPRFGSISRALPRT